MISRKEFARHLAKQELSHIDRAVALLYYYRESQEYDERSASELSGDLHDEGFARPNVTRLREGLTRCRLTTRGSKRGYFQIDLRRIGELSAAYDAVLKVSRVEVTKHVIPPEWVFGTRAYLEKMVYQINASFEFALYDACAVLMRRLMESLIIEIYIHEKRHHEIQTGGGFFMLEKLIAHLVSDRTVILSRNTPKAMTEIKQLGDTAAHDRTYITAEVDLSESAPKFRRVIQELLSKAGIQKKG